MSENDSNDGRNIRNINCKRFQLGFKSVKCWRADEYIPTMFHTPCLDIPFLTTQ